MKKRTTSNSREHLSAWIVALLATLMPFSVSAESLRDFVDQLASLESIGMEAHAVIRLRQDGVTRAGNGTFSYWEQGSLYRISCSTSGPLKLVTDFDYSNDGEYSRLWFRASNTLLENTSDDQLAPTAIPNPFFLATIFVTGEDCVQCRLSREGVLQSVGNMSVSTDSPGVYSVENSEFGRQFIVETLDVEGMEVPSVISWWNSMFDADVVVELGDYQRLDGGLLWPTAVSMTSTGRSSDLSAVITYLIGTFEQNRTYPKDTFTLGDEDSVYVEAPAGPDP